MKFYGANGVASAQAFADLLTLILAVPIIISVLKKIKRVSSENQQ